jgi:lysophospholipase L1-like esterase
MLHPVATLSRRLAAGLLLLGAASTAAQAIEYPYPYPPQELANDRTIFDAYGMVRDPAKRPLYPHVDSWIDKQGVHATLVKNVEAMKGAVDVALIGDSITQHWLAKYAQSKITTPAMAQNAEWLAAFPELRTVNLGIAGDKIEGVLWRLENGALTGSNAKVVVIAIGTNDVGWVPASGDPAKIEQVVNSIARGIAMCAQRTVELQPQAQVVVLRLLPRGTKVPPPAALKDSDPKRYQSILDSNRGFALVGRINAALALEAQKNTDKRITFVDQTAGFLGADGDLNPTCFLSDRLHLTKAGYEVYARALKPCIDAALAPPEQRLPSMTIYQDALASGWYQNGWSSAIGVANTACVRSGRSFAATITAARGAAGVVARSGAFDTRPYESVSFWIHGGPQGGQELALRVQRPGGITAGKTLGRLPAGAWQRFTIPLSELGAAGITDLQALRFHLVGAAPAAQFFVDDLVLDGAVQPKAVAGIG